MYNDVKKKTNFKIADENDIKEIREILDYVKNLVIKDQNEADKYETIETIRSSTVYISAVLELNDTDDLDRHIIIEAYEEKNEYYKKLKEYYDIDYVDARIANDFTILKVLKPTLKREDEALFNECYNETLKYYRNVIFTKAFSNQEYNYEYFKLLIISLTIQKYLTRKLGYYFNIDLYDKKKLKNSFISYGFDFFDILPLNYQRRLLKLINELVMSKGTNDALNKLLNVFGFDNINLYKYVLAKKYELDSNGDIDYSEPKLVFYKTKASDVINYEKDMVLNYDEVTQNDPFWKCDKDELLYRKKFNTITTKYMSVDLSLNIVEETMKMSYFAAFLYKMEKDYKHLETSDFGFFNRDISSKIINIFDAVVGLQSLILRSHKLSDKINKKPKLLDVYGYNNIENNSDIANLIKEIKILLIQNKHSLEWKRQFSELYKYFNSFNLKNFSDPTDYTDMGVLYDMYNNYSIVKNELNNGLARYTDDVCLKEFLKDEDNDVIDKLEYLRVYVLRGEFRCQDIGQYEDVSNLFSKYIVMSGMMYPEKRVAINNIFFNNFDLYNDIKYMVDNINTPKIIDTFNNNDFFGTIDLIIDFVSNRRQEIKKKYNLTTNEELKAMILYDPMDILVHKELYNFFNLFYKPFKDLNYDKKYSIDGFMNIFMSNEELRKQLQEFIIEVDNYDLYRKFNKLFEMKMITKANNDVYEGCETFSEFIANRNYEFYKWMTPDDITNSDSKKRLDFFNSRIFELCECIDNYISEDLFINNTYTGIIDYIRKVLYLVVTVFKSYTIDLIDSNTVLNVNDKSFNSFRLFDEIYTNVSDQVVGKISLQDVYRTFVYEQFSEKVNIDFKEEISIKEITD